MMKQTQLFTLAVCILMTAWSTTLAHASTQILHRRRRRQPRRYNPASRMSVRWRSPTASVARRTAFPSQRDFYYCDYDGYMGSYDGDVAHNDVGSLSSSLPSAFNHNCVGITNPVLQVNLDPYLDRDTMEKGKDCGGGKGSFQKRKHGGGMWVATRRFITERSGEWVTASLEARNKMREFATLKSEKCMEDHATPSLSTCYNDYEECDGWRMYRFRKVVGLGDECYRRVRDAALGWEKLHAGSKWAGIHLLHAADDSRCGSNRNSPFVRMLQRHVNTKNAERVNDRMTRDDCIHDPVSSTVYQERDPLRMRPTKSVQQIANCPGVKKIATFSKLSKFLPIWIVNPCMIVYDLVDERIPASCKTYSASAYATMRGHLLCGEERVAVAIDDITKEVSVEVLSFSHASSGIFNKLAFGACKEMQRRFFQEQIDTLQKIARDMEPSLPVLRKSTETVNSNQIESYEQLDSSRIGASIDVQGSPSFFDLRLINKV